MSPPKMMMGKQNSISHTERKDPPLISDDSLRESINVSRSPAPHEDRGPALTHSKVRNAGEVYNPLDFENLEMDE